MKKFCNILMDLFIASCYGLAFYCYLLMFLYASDRSIVMVGGLAFLTTMTGGAFSILSRAVVWGK